jgi:hypothetical protein
MFRSIVLGIAVLVGASVSANAQSADDQALCQDDAFRICSATIPDRERTFQCMIQNRESLSPGCKAVMAKLLPPDPPAQKRRPSKLSRSASSDAEGEKPAKPRKGGPINLSPPAR